MSTAANAKRMDPRKRIEIVEDEAVIAPELRDRLTQLGDQVTGVRARAAAPPTAPIEETC